MRLSNCVSARLTKPFNRVDNRAGDVAGLMQEILFIKTSSLGDVIHHMPALTEAQANIAATRGSRGWWRKRSYRWRGCIRRSARSSPVSSRRWRKLLSPSAWGRHPEIQGRVTEPEQYDKVIDTQGLARTGLIAKIARGERHGYDRDSIREKFASRFYQVRHQVPRDIHAIARNRILTGLAPGL